MDSSSVEVGEAEGSQVQGIVGNDMDPAPGGDQPTRCREMGWTAFHDRLLQ